jgi:tellurite resistance protein TerC
MSNIESLATGPMWAGFIAFVLAMLLLDLFVLGGNKAHRVSAREAACWTATWSVQRGNLCATAGWAAFDKSCGEFMDNA